MNGPIRQTDVATLKLAAKIVAAYISENHTPISELPGLISGVHSTLTALASVSQPVAIGAIPTARKPTPAQIKESIRSDALISFIDGTSYKTLKRHLQAHGLNPHSYRERFGLPASYPMTAASYALQRSLIAKAIGLGMRRAPQPSANPVRHAIAASAS